MQTSVLLRLPMRSLLVLLLAVAAAPAYGQGKPLPVYVLVGQSNMQGHAHVRTLEAMGMDPETAPLLRELCTEEGKPRIFEDVWIASLSAGGVKAGPLTVGFGASPDKVGPELAFGATMRKHLGRPVLLVKAAWGGKSLHTDFRPPSAGPYAFTEAQKRQLEKQGKSLDAVRAEKVQATGRYYRLTIEHVKAVLADVAKVHPDYDRRRGYELAGFVWFQGWNDMVDRGTYPDRGKPGGYDGYAEVLTHLIRDVRKELAAPDLPFVIGVLGVGGPVAAYGPDQRRYAATHQGFRDAMAAPASDPDLGHVTAVRTERFWDAELAALRSRDGRIRRSLAERRKEGDLTREQEQAALEAQRAEAFTPRERLLLAKGISNAEYHYLGSATILSRIGVAFAEALLEKEEDR